MGRATITATFSIFLLPIYLHMPAPYVYYMEAHRVRRTGARIARRGLRAIAVVV